eukprot:4114761-Amphidinium_carterae.1
MALGSPTSLTVTGRQKIGGRFLLSGCDTQLPGIQEEWPNAANVNLYRDGRQDFAPLDGTIEPIKLTKSGYRQREIANQTVAQFNSLGYY